MEMDKNDVVIIKLDRPRQIRFGHKAIKKLQAMDIDIEGDFDLTRLEEIMYVGLQYDSKQNNETLKLEDMEDLLDEAPSYNEIVEKMQMAFEAAFGKIEIDEKNLQRVAENSKKTKKK
jgi:outer membrane receptor for ferric coprogen and ferric-rhodotorulic acid